MDEERTKNADGVPTPHEVPPSAAEHASTDKQTRLDAVYADPLAARKNGHGAKDYPEWQIGTVGTRLLWSRQQKKIGGEGTRITLGFQFEGGVTFSTLVLTSQSKISCDFVGKLETKRPDEAEWEDTATCSMNAPIDNKEVRLLYLKLWDAASGPSYRKDDWSRLGDVLRSAGYRL